MRLRSFGASWALRPALGLLIVGGAIGASGQLNIRSMPPEFIQKNTVHEPSFSRMVVPKGQVDTYSFFPQIDSSIGQRSFVRPHASPRERLNFNIRGGIDAGGIGGSSRAMPDRLFPGITYTGSIPPDPHMAVGPNHVVQVVNSRISFFDKASGAQLFAQNSSQFFSGIGANPSQFDPRVVYDHYNDRWIIMTLATDTTTVSQILFAASDDDNPMGLWNRFVLDTTVDIGSEDSWVDYPMVGMSQDALVIGGNAFGFDGGFAAVAFVVRTAGLYNNTGVQSTGFVFAGTSEGHSIQPGDTFTPGSTTIYAINLAPPNAVRLWAFTGVDTATPAATSTIVPVQAYSSVGSAPSGGLANGLDTISDRVMDSMSRNEFFLAAHTVRLQGNTQSSVRWYEFNMGSWPASGLPSIAQQGNITLNLGEWALMPAICKNVFDDISIIYTRSSASIFSDLVVSTRVASDAPGVMGVPTLLRSGLGSNQGGFRARWGDYFAAVVDPNDDATFWGNGEVTRTDGLWATEIQSWTVTTGGGGGGGGGVDYDVITIGTFMGAYAAGTAAEVSTSDNLFFDVNSVDLSGQGHFGAVQADFLIAEPPANVTELNVRVEANVDPGVTATGMVFFWNWNTSKFEYGKAFDIQKLGNDIQSVKIKENPSRFVSPTGQVRIVFRAHDQYRRRGVPPNPFKMRTDLVKLNVKT